MALAALLVAARMCHVGILWEGDSYPLAAAGQMLRGQTLYRDIWFDKPPVTALFSLLAGARAGLAATAGGRPLCPAGCGVCYGFARDLWSRREGLWAAGLAGFFLIFDFPAAVIPAASDLLMLAPHVAAVWLAWKRRPFCSGVLAGVAFWISPKGLFVAAACALWNPGGNPRDGGWLCGGRRRGGVGLWSLRRIGGLLGGGLGVGTPLRRQLSRSIAADERSGANGSIGRVFMRPSPSRRDASCGAKAGGVNGGARTRVAQKRHSPMGLGWMGRHRAGGRGGGHALLSALLPPVAAGGDADGGARVHAARAPARERGATRSAGAAFIGPPVCCWTAGRRVALLLSSPWRGSRPPTAALTRPEWRDTAMDRDSRAAAAVVGRLARPGDTLFVWGYRPEIYVYTRLPAATRYLDSQPLTGVPADRHLTQSTPVETAMAGARRAELAGTRPAFIVDGLGLYNPRLALESFADLRPWLAGYREVARTGGTVIYRAQSLSGPAGRALP